MCARFALDFGAPPDDALLALADATYARGFVDAASRALPVIRPTDAVPIVVIGGEVRPMAWGLIPHWAKDPTIARQTFNARAETVAVKPAFRDAYRRQRCLIPFSLWVEWTGPKGARTPLALSLDGALGAFAGLHAGWRDADGVSHETFTMLTTSAAPATANVHDRMPLVLAPANWRAWVEGSVEAAALMIAPYDGPVMVTALAK